MNQPRARTLTRIFDNRLSRTFDGPLLSLLVLLGCVLYLLGLLFMASPARGEELPRETGEKFSLGVFLGPSAAYSDRNGWDVDLDQAGLRGTWHLHSRWTLEVDASRASLDSGSRDETRLELSARRFLHQSGRVELFGLAGLGWQDVDREQDFSPFDEDSLTAHLGIGWEIPLGDRFFFRPDLRLRWVDENRTNDDDIGFTGSVGLGLRL